MCDEKMRSPQPLVTAAHRRGVSRRMRNRMTTQKSEQVESEHACCRSFGTFDLRHTIESQELPCTLEVKSCCWLNPAWISVQD